MDTSKMNIFEKLLAISSELAPIERDLDVEQSNGKRYSALSEKAVLDAIKPLEAKYRVYSYPAKRTRTSQVMKREWVDKDTGQLRQTTLLVDRIDVCYRFINVDKPDECIEVDSYGTGIDTADKGVGKAMTYADKYALMKAYKVAAGAASDPDSVSSPLEDLLGSFTPAPDAPTTSKAALEAAKVKGASENTQPQVEKPPAAAPRPEPITEPVPEPMKPQQPIQPQPAQPSMDGDELSLFGDAQEPANAMTVEEARAFVLPIGTEKGKTLGEALATNRRIVEFYAGDKFKNKRYPKLKEAAQVLLGSV